MGAVKRLEMLTEELKEYPSVLSKDQVCGILGLSKRKLDDIIDKKIVPSFVIDPDSNKKQVRINKSDLMLYMLNNGEQA